jgi:hypothetical protein
MATGRGAFDAAQHLLRDAAALAPPGLWRALIGLDLAGALAGADQPEAAVQALQALGAWVQALPAGRRLALELGMAAPGPLR